MMGRRVALFLAAAGVASAFHKAVVTRSGHHAAAAQRAGLSAWVRPVATRGGLHMSIQEPDELNKLEEEEDGKLRLGEGKLVYDPRTGRFSEKEIQEICREEFCARDEKTGQPILLTVKEKERIFLDCIQSYYYNGRQILTDEDFNKLKEDLIWEGSKVALLNRNETLFLNAMGSYLKGQPILSDPEFDELKRSLKEAQSPIAVSTEPKCYVDTGICTVTFQKDFWRKGVLYIPGGLISLFAWLILSYELIEPLRYVNPILLIGLGSPAVWYGSKFLTDRIFFPDALIAYGGCPACNAPNRIFFGDILGVEGPKETADLTCRNCGTLSTVTRSTLRCVTFPKGEEEEQKDTAKAARGRRKASVGADDDE